MKMEFFQTKRSQLVTFGMLYLTLTVESMMGKTKESPLRNRLDSGYGKWEDPSSPPSETPTPETPTEEKIDYYNDNQEREREHISVQCYTDNLAHMKRHELAAHVSALAQHAVRDGNCPDILVFGFQEARYSKRSFNWPKTRRASNKKSFDFIKHHLRAYLNKAVAGESIYKCKASDRVLGKFSKGIYIYVFVKQDTGITFKKLHTSQMTFGKTGYSWVGGNNWANKGCTLIHGNVGKKVDGKRQSRQITFLCCHNASDDKARNRRDWYNCVRQIEKITKMDKGFVQDALFMMGDFNPRILGPNDKWIKKAKKPKGICRGWKWSPTFIEEINKMLTSDYNHQDQINTSDWRDINDDTGLTDAEHKKIKFLNLTLTNPDLPRGYRCYPVNSIDTFGALKEQGPPSGRWTEAAIRFKPTYVFRQGSSEYDTSENKTYTWADRIIYRSSVDVRTGTRRVDVNSEDYDALPRSKLDRWNQSDHSPVYARFTVRFC